MIYSREFVWIWGYLTYRDFQLGEVERLWCEALMFMYVRLWQQCGCICMWLLAPPRALTHRQKAAFLTGRVPAAKRLSSSPLLTIHLKKLDHATGGIPVRLDNIFASKSNHPNLSFRFTVPLFTLVSAVILWNLYHQIPSVEMSCVQIPRER